MHLFIEYKLLIRR